MDTPSTSSSEAQSVQLFPNHNSCNRSCPSLPKHQWIFTPKRPAKIKARPTALLNESVILSHPCACKASMKKEDTFVIIWDSGCSISVSPDRDDFVGPLTKPPNKSSIQGISNSLKIQGIGHVRWSVLDTKGKLRHLKLPAHFIPKLNQRLLSTSSFTNVHPDNSITV